VHVGLVEKYELSMALFEREFGWPRFSVGRANACHDRPRLDDLDPDDIEAIRDANLFDIELYEFATRLFESRSRDLLSTVDSAC